MTFRRSPDAVFARHPVARLRICRTCPHVAHAGVLRVAGELVTALARPPVIGVARRLGGVLACLRGALLRLGTRLGDPAIGLGLGFRLGLRRLGLLHAHVLGVAGQIVALLARDLVLGFGTHDARFLVRFHGALVLGVEFGVGGALLRLRLGLADASALPLKLLHACLADLYCARCDPSRPVGVPVSAAPYAAPASRRPGRRSHGNGFERHR
jgi:hypothetical protein